MTKPPTIVLEAFSIAQSAKISPITIGLINRTYLVEEANQKSVLQRVNPIFGPSVHYDIEAITSHIEARGLLTPRLLRTKDDALFLLDEERAAWRRLSFLEGVVLPKVQSPQMAYAAGSLVARFHQAVSTLSHQFHFSRPGAHDTPLHLSRLQDALQKNASHARYSIIAPIAEEILAFAKRLTPLPAGPIRIIHGDLKISNILFGEDLREARALLDLDTMAHSTIPIELGDAFRSWCNPGGEEAGAATFREDFFKAGIEGYAQHTKEFLTKEEQEALVLGAKTISLELSARFCADALNESYFGWDASRYASRSEHNEVRALSQLAVARSIEAQQRTLEEIVKSVFP